MLSVAHERRALMCGSRVFPLSESEYSTRGGTILNEELKW